MRITNTTLSGKFNYESSLSGKMELKMDSCMDQTEAVATMDHLGSGDLTITSSTLPDGLERYVCMPACGGTAAHLG